MLDIKGLFDESYYLNKNPDVAAAVAAGGISSGFDHFINRGQFERRDPSAFFDTDYYLETNPDVVAAVETGETTAIQHFINSGQFEKRDPILEFFTDNYLALNPDVAAAVERDELTGIQHFVEFGQYEGREPGFFFDTNFYLQQYPDVAAAVKPGGLSPIKHYLEFGLDEGRESSPPLPTIQLSPAENLGTLGSITRSEFVGNADTQDVYSFTLNATSNVRAILNGAIADADISLIEDSNGNGVVDEFETVDFSNAEGAAPEEINNLLPAGTYFVLVEQFEGETNYNLSLSATPFTPPADTAGNTPNAARNIGTISGSQNLNGFVGSADKQDFYSFTLSTDSAISLLLDGLSADAELRLIQDTNRNGIVEETEILESSESPGNDPEAIFSSALRAGTYYILVEQFEGETNYNLSLSATPVIIPLDSAGEELGTANNLGVLSGRRTVSDFVGTLDPTDVYRFTTNATADLNLRLEGLSADADITLVQDANGNGIVEETEIFDLSEQEGATPEAIDISGLPAGTYFVGIEQFEGDTTYSLNLSATSSAALPTRPAKRSGEVLQTAEVQGSAVFSKTGLVNPNNQDDYYSFTVGESGIFTANLTGLSGDADVRLIRDFNGNGQVDAVADRNNNGFIDDSEIEVVAWQWERGTGNESIRSFLQPGTYFVQVTSFEKQTANYALNTNFTPAPSDPLDFSIQLNFGQGTEDLTEAERNTIRQAAHRIEQLVSHSTFDGTHVITINATASDQGSRLLASAGPESFKLDLNRRKMTTTGEASINNNPKSDVRANQRYLYDTMIHEFGHVLGIGTLWDEKSGRNLIADQKDGLYTLTSYSGVYYGELLGTEVPTPVELTVGEGEGSDLAHWRKIPIFEDEIMVESGGKEDKQVTSELTIATLKDIGFNVNYGAAEKYVLPKLRPPLG